MRPSDHPYRTPLRENVNSSFMIQSARYPETQLIPIHLTYRMAFLIFDAMRAFVLVGAHYASHVIRVFDPLLTGHKEIPVGLTHLRRYE